MLVVLLSSTVDTLVPNEVIDAKAAANPATNPPTPATPDTISVNALKPAVADATPADVDAIDDARVAPSPNVETSPIVSSSVYISYLAFTTLSSRVSRESLASYI